MVSRVQISLPLLFNPEKRILGVIFCEAAAGCWGGVLRASDTGLYPDKPVCKRRNEDRRQQTERSDRGVDPTQNNGNPTEIFEPDNANEFLGKWHNVCMVVDGKGRQRTGKRGNGYRRRKLTVKWPKGLKAKQKNNLKKKLKKGKMKVKEK